VNARSINKELWCGARQLVYHPAEKRGFIFVGRSECVDMGGSIRVFSRLDPAVREIITVAGGEVDTIYTRTGKMWTAQVRTSDDKWLVGQPCLFSDGRRS
jgi:hypothetical protein